MVTPMFKVKIGRPRDSRGRFGRRSAARHDVFVWTSPLPVASWLQTADGRWRRRLGVHGKPIGQWERAA